jgi:hypothetical protein
MVSVMDIRDKPSVHHWDSVTNRDKFLTKEQMVLSYEIYLVAKQIKKSYVVPSNEGIEFSTEWYAWATQVSLRSPLTQALMTCRENVYELVRSLGDLVMFNTRDSKDKNAMYKVPDIVALTNQQGRQIIHGIDQWFRKLGGDAQDQVNWKGAQQCFLYKSDAFLRLLHDCIGDFMSKFEDISVERDYPWLVRFTENIIRDAPSQFNAYHMYLSRYQDKREGLRKEEMARVHEEYVPYHHDLVIDLLEEGEDRMSVWEKRTMGTTSSGKTTEEASSHRYPSPGKVQTKTPSRTSGRGNGNDDRRIPNT